MIIACGIGGDILRYVGYASAKANAVGEQPFSIAVLHDCEPMYDRTFVQRDQGGGDRCLGRGRRQSRLAWPCDTPTLVTLVVGEEAEALGGLGDSRRV